MERRAHLQIKKLDVRNDKRSVVSDMRIDMARFAELDTARNQYLTYPMFLKMMPKKMRKMFEDDQLLSWAASADLDGDGILSVTDYWRWSLRCATEVHGQDALKQMFLIFDSDGTGKLDALEFEACLSEMGYGAVANKIFRDLDNDASGTIT